MNFNFNNLPNPEKVINDVEKDNNILSVKNGNVTPGLFNINNNMTASQEKEQIDNENNNNISNGMKNGSDGQNNINNMGLNDHINLGQEYIGTDPGEEIPEKSEGNKIRDIVIKERGGLNENMTNEIANEITYRLIKYRPDFKSFEEVKEMNDFVSLTSLSTISQLPEKKDSYYKITQEQFEDISSPSSSFDIKQRAKEFGIKLKGLVDSGEVIITCSDEQLLIIVNVFKICNSINETKGSIILKIIFPKQRHPPKPDQVNLSETFQIADKIDRGFKISNQSASAVILETIIKSGIDSILSGPICASIGFCD